ncbi:MAG: hypothetical protein NC328_07440 [Muribaculum sp.]|nr:hypothetical protein [Muribaculum sp.]
MNHPYFISPIIRQLKKETDPQKRRLLKMRLAVNVCDSSTLRDILGLDSESLSEFYPSEEMPCPDTDATIEAFLQHFAPSADSTPQDLISEYPEISDTEPDHAIPTSPTEPDPAEESLLDPKQSSPASAPLTLGFAKILIKNGNYAKAIDIITNLNLNNNQKSIYFADQIRFLKKLMANQAKSQALKS